jgi:hypothetical protein
MLSDMTVAFAHFRALVAGLVMTALVPSAVSAGPFGTWAAIVVAGDYRAHDGVDAEVFDNARRTIAGKLVEIGFNPANVRQFSVRPGRYVEGPLATDFNVITDTLNTITETARGGCFIYFTSHGAPQGILLADKILPPDVMAELVDGACRDQPTVMVISACYSGVFIPALATDNRMIITAARPDRPSFGCSEDLEYTYFDQCILQSIPASPTFPDLAMNARNCVDAREEAEKVTPPSEPQIFVGARIAPLLVYYTLAP